MSPNKDETGRRIVSDAVVVDRAVKFIVYIIVVEKKITKQIFLDDLEK